MSSDLKAPTTETGECRISIAREFFTEQLPLIVMTFAAGLGAAYLQHGIVPGGDVAFPVAGVRVPIWHLVWLGVWTGYTLALVGEASGIFALPYTMSVLQFSSPAVSPTTQILTLFNPLGALFGFRRNRQWNLDFALWVCVGGAAGALIGPFIRLTLLSDVKPFTFVVGLALVFVGGHLCIAAIRGFLSRHSGVGIDARFRAQAQAQRAAGRAPAGVPPGTPIETVSKGRDHITIGFWGETWTVRPSTLFIIGFGVGIISSALGVGGGFLLVPILAMLYHLPMYVVVAATIPYVIVLSLVALITYSGIVPAITGISIAPEWAWGLFAASGGILGSWAAAKTQRFVPEYFLKVMLGAITSIAGLLYVLDMFVDLPFKL
jgi:hypothetical protein